MTDVDLRYVPLFPLSSDIVIPFLRGSQRTPATTAGNSRVSQQNLSMSGPSRPEQSTQTAPPIPRRSRFVQVGGPILVRRLN